MEHDFLNSDQDKISFYLYSSNVCVKCLVWLTCFVFLFFSVVCMKQHHGISFVYPFLSDGLSHTYRYNKYGIVHFVF